MINVYGQRCGYIGSEQGQLKNLSRCVVTRIQETKNTCFEVPRGGLSGMHQGPSDSGISDLSSKCSILMWALNSESLTEKHEFLTTGASLIASRVG